MDDLATHFHGNLHEKYENISITKITYLIRPLIKYAPTILLKTNDPHHLIRKIPLEDFLAEFKNFSI